jgi:hypothetical protein
MTTSFYCNKQSNHSINGNYQIYSRSLTYLKHLIRLHGLLVEVLEHLGFGPKWKNLFSCLLHMASTRQQPTTTKPFIPMQVGVG